MSKPSKTGITPGIKPACDTKRLANLKARAALAGVTLHTAIENGVMIYIVSRWYLTKVLDTIGAAESWLDQVTGVAHG